MPAIADAISKVARQREEGESIVQTARGQPRFSADGRQHDRRRRRTGQLPQMLLKIADVYDDEVDNAGGGDHVDARANSLSCFWRHRRHNCARAFHAAISIISGLQQQT